MLPIKAIVFEASCLADAEGPFADVAPALRELETMGIQLHAAAEPARTMYVTDNADGIAQAELDMPQNLTTWKIRVWALGHGTRVGEDSTDVVTRKNIIVRMQAPRFFVEADEVVLSANVHNYLADAKQVKVRLGVISPRDSGLVRHHNKPITQCRRRPAKGEYPINEPNFIRLMQIANLLVHHAVPIKKDRPRFHLAGLVVPTANSHFVRLAFNFGCETSRCQTTA